MEDLVRFAEALRGEKLLKKETWSLLARAKPELNSPDYGYGFELYGDAVGHTGAFAGISAQFLLYPESGHAIAVLSNYGVSATVVADQARALLRQRAVLELSR